MTTENLYFSVEADFEFPPEGLGPHDVEERRKCYYSTEAIAVLMISAEA